MQRQELEHLIRASGAITGADDIIVIGSQAILASYPDAPASLLQSMEADLYTLRDPHDSELIEGSIGEGSPFHETFGYYAQGVWKDTAELPDGWLERAIPIQNENTRNTLARCLEPHDLAVAKLIAGREKDREFLLEMLRAKLIDPAIVEQRLSTVPSPSQPLQTIQARWHRIVIAAAE